MTRTPPARLVAALILALAVMWPALSARADVYLSPGLKLGYTFGEGGGLTIGGELSMPFLARADRLEVALGAALNIDYRVGGAFAVRFGPQLTSLFFGVEGGPSLVFHEDKVRLGFGVTPWAGAVLIPYYTFTTVLEGPNWHEVGGYLKMPLDCRDRSSGTQCYFLLGPM